MGRLGKNKVIGCRQVNSLSEVLTAKGLERRTVEVEQGVRTDRQIHIGDNRTIEQHGEELRLAVGPDRDGKGAQADLITVCITAEILDAAASRVRVLHDERVFGAERRKLAGAAASQVGLAKCCKTTLRFSERTEHSRE